MLIYALFRKSSFMNFTELQYKKVYFYLNLSNLFGKTYILTRLVCIAAFLLQKLKLFHILFVRVIYGGKSEKSFS